jgi:CRP/FNR family cyclic AMP-dependent transcriptional regulator
MTEPTLVETLRTSRFLEDISEEELQRIASVGQLETHQPGAVIFREGEEVSCVFLVADGSVSLEICLPGQGCRRIQTIGQGELLGWSPLLGKVPMSATAWALTGVRLVALDAAQMQALFHFDPRFGYTFMRRAVAALATRLNATRLQLLDVYRSELPLVAGTHEGAD